MAGHKDVQFNTLFLNDFIFKIRTECPFAHRNAQALAMRVFIRDRCVNDAPEKGAALTQGEADKPCAQRPFGVQDALTQKWGDGDQGCPEHSLCADDVLDLNKPQLLHKDAPFRIARQ
ncbi:hypothetical protein [Yoonia sp. SS1-5]|uniref:Uncharacterized protein n=1 Tax=Yoonia rhodophyticola TaxID=3137370 RepID=A0AAN0MG48_9RHOB